MFHVEHGYLEAWKRYRRVLSQRNAALKARASPAELRTWTLALVEFNQAAHNWNIEFEVPDGPEVLITVPHGTPHDMKLAVEQQMDEEVERVKSHKH